MTDKIIDELPDARRSIARALGRGCAWAVDEVLTQIAFDGLAIVKADVIDAKDKQIAELEAGGWQPIETAPKGVLLLFFPAENRSQLPAMMRIDNYPVSYPRQPSHWQPAPNPPVSEPYWQPLLLNKEDRNG